MFGGGGYAGVLDASFPVCTAGIGPVLLAVLQFPAHGGKGQTPPSGALATNKCRMGSRREFVGVFFGSVVGI